MESLIQSRETELLEEERSRSGNKSHSQLWSLHRNFWEGYEIYMYLACSDGQNV